MEINGKVSMIKIGAYVNNVRENKKAEGPTQHESEAVFKGDKVDLSQTATDVKNAKAQLDSIPDIRGQKISEIKNQIDQGTYKIDGEKIAFNMIRESLIDEIV